MKKEIEILDYLEFKCEIAYKLKLDFERDIFDIQDDATNIISERREILECNEDKYISLNKLNTKDLESIKEITCYYTETRNKEDYDEYKFTIFDTYEEAKEYYDKCCTKTMEDWKNSNCTNFEDFCKPGDIVGNDIVNEFLNSVPPITHFKDFIQAGEPYGHEIDFEDNKCKPTYTTFEKEGNNWIYKGNCFKGKNTDMTYNIENNEESEDIEQ